MGLFDSDPMSSPGGGGSQAPLITALIGVGALAGVWIHDPGLSSLRPAVPSARAVVTFEGEDLRARLWEDPFLALPSELDEAGGHGHRLSSLRRHVSERKALSRTIYVLPVMVTGGLAAEDSENRRRQRMAVMAGLGRSGFVPEHDEFIGYVRTHWTHGQAPRLTSPVAESSASAGEAAAARTSIGEIGSAPEVRKPVPFSIPYEWFRSERELIERSSAKDAVLVMWMNESLLGRDPLGMLEQVLEQVTVPGAMEIRVLGPATSGGLRELLRREPPPVGDPANRVLAYLIEQSAREAGFEPSGVEEQLRGLEFKVPFAVPGGVQDEAPRDLAGLRYAMLRHYEWFLAGRGVSATLEPRPEDELEALLELGRARSQLIKELASAAGEPVVEGGLPLELTIGWAVDAWLEDSWRALLTDSKPLEREWRYAHLIVTELEDYLGPLSQEHRAELLESLIDAQEGREQEALVASLAEALALDPKLAEPNASWVFDGDTSGFVADVLLLDQGVEAPRLAEMLISAHEEHWSPEAEASVRAVAEPTKPLFASIDGSSWPPDGRDAMELGFAARDVSVLELYHEPDLPQLRALEALDQRSLRIERRLHEALEQPTREDGAEPWGGWDWILQFSVQQWFQIEWESYLSSLELSPAQRHELWGLSLVLSMRGMFDEPLGRAEFQSLERVIGAGFDQLDATGSLRAGTKAFAQVARDLAGRVESELPPVPHFGDEFGWPEYFEGWANGFGTLSALARGWSGEAAPSGELLLAQLRQYLDDPAPLDAPGKEQALAADIDRIVAEVIGASPGQPAQAQAGVRAAPREQVVQRLVRLLDESLPDVDDSDEEWAQTSVEVWLGPSLGKQDAGLRPRMRIYSTRATVPEEYLGLAATDDVESRVRHLLRAEPEDRGGFVSAVASDRELAELLVGELDQRGFRLSGGDHIALVGEWDSFYGRMYPLTFRAALVAAGMDVQVSEKVVRPVGYLRGLDGAKPGEQVRSQRAAQDGVQPASRRQLSDYEHPAGRSQLDYVRRLEDQLRELKETVGRGERLFAVGVVGTDVYDKLMILQALRSDFPETVFFTTDLDARLAHSSQYKWCRNLVVASSYGLELDAPTQGRYAPFRDGYQTATYLACLLALRGVAHPTLGAVTEENFRPLVRPRLYEIGRGGAYDITPAERDSNAGTLHPPPQRGFVWRWRWGVGLALFFLACASFRRRRDVGRAGWIATLGTALAIIAVYLLARFDARDGMGEPFELTSGVSVWPTILIQAITLALSIALLVYSEDRLRGDSNSTGADLGLDTSGAGEGSAGALWSRFRAMDRGRVGRRAVFVRAAFYIPLCLILFALAHENAHVRSDLARYAENATSTLCLVAFVLLTFRLVQGSRACEALVQGLLERRVSWSAESRRRRADLLGVPDVDCNDVEGALDLELAARSGETLGKLTLWPFVLLGLILLSRSRRLFDDWGSPWAQLVAYGLLLLALLWRTYRLRELSEGLRRVTIERLARTRFELIGQQEAGARRERLGGLATLAQSLRRGAFAPWSQRPGVRALLIPFGGAGAVALLELMGRFDV